MTQPLRQTHYADDDWLGRLVTAGDSRAFSVLYERYRDPLYRYCRSIVWSEADAHDAVQSTFVQALEALRRDQRDAPLRPWLFRIAHNEAISLLRRRAASDVAVDRLRQITRGVEDPWQDREEVGSLFADLRHLPEPARGAIVLRELLGLSHAEIAVALGTTVSSAKHAVFQARQALAEFARGRQMDCGQVRLAIVEDDRRVLRSRRIRAHLRHCPVCARFAESRGLHRRRRLAPAIAPSAILAKLFSPKAHLRASDVPGGPVATNTLTDLGSKCADALMATKAATVVGALAAAGAVGAGSTISGTQDARPAHPLSGLAAWSVAAPAYHASAGGWAWAIGPPGVILTPVLGMRISSRSSPAQTRSAGGVSSRDTGSVLPGGSRPPRLGTQARSASGKPGIAAKQAAPGAQGRGHAGTRSATHTGVNPAGNTRWGGNGNAHGAGNGNARGAGNGNARGAGNGNAGAASTGNRRGASNGNAQAAGNGNGPSVGSGNGNGGAQGPAGPAAAAPTAAGVVRQALGGAAVPTTTPDEPLPHVGATPPATARGGRR